MLLYTMYKDDNPDFVKGQLIVISLKTHDKGKQAYYRDMTMIGLTITEKSKTKRTRFYPWHMIESICTI